MKKKENIIIIVLLIVMVIAVIGVSWAAFNYSATGTKLNSITTGSITMSYEETDNTISLNAALPTTDKTGMVRLNDGEYFDFTVSSKIVGDLNINYEITAKDVTDSGVRKIDGSNIKLYLTKLNADGTEEGLMTPDTYNEEASANDYTGRPSGEMSLYTSSMSSSETNNYRLRMYVTEEYNPQGDGGGLQFSVQINVYGKDGDKPLSAGETVIENLTSGSTFDDGVDTFITGDFAAENPNNYIWYSGKLWRAVSVNNESKTTKLVTQWNISTTTYNPENQTNFEGSYMEDWLNDTTVDGFLGNLRDYEDFIVTDAVWDATMDSNDIGKIQRPDGTTTVTAPVGLLNMYEYQSSSHGVSLYMTCYLDNRLSWWTLTPDSVSSVRNVSNVGYANNSRPSYSNGVRPSINLKSNVKIVDGDGTIDNPYRLNGDNDTNLSGTPLSSRYSGEYIRFGNDENNLYRIVSHENGTGTKIVSAEPLKNAGTFITSAFGTDTTFSSTNTIGTFLNNDYLNTGNGYLTDEEIAMIEDNTTWYLGTVGDGTSYKLAKYTDTNMSNLTSSQASAKVGLLRIGELLAGQFNIGISLKNTDYWTLTPDSTSYVRNVTDIGFLYSGSPTDAAGVRPSINLKSNVIITGGIGTKSDPFFLALGS